MQDLQITLPIGTKVRDRYVIEGLLGKGGFGAVYLVKDQRVKSNLFAMKEVVDPDKKERVRFTFEGEVLKRLDHSALPRVYRVFEDDKNGRAYMLMDYIEGPNLETLRQRQTEKRFPLSQVMNIMAPIISAASYLHAQQPPIIHRDIKPANIIVPTAGDEAMLVDFGIAKEYEPDSTTTAVRRCSPGYGAPEQYSRGTNTHTDIYGLGATIYALLTGEVPDDAFYRMTQLGSNGVDPLEPPHKLVPSIPVHVSQAIMRAMAISSADRFPTADAFWQALNARPIAPITPPIIAPVSPDETTAVAANNVKNTPQVAVYPITPASTATRKRRLLPVLLLLLALALIAGSAFAYFGTRHGNSPTTPGTTTSPVTSHSSPVSSATVGHTPTTAPSSTSTGGQTPTNPPATPTSPPPAGYPSVAGTHSGSAHNLNNGYTANMTLTFTQSQRNLGGNVTINSPLAGSGPITSGSVGTNYSIQFVVSSTGGLNPIAFSGTVAGNGNMSGTYCSINSAGNCDPAAGGHGTWNAGGVSGSPGGS